VPPQDGPVSSHDDDILDFDFFDEEEAEGREPRIERRPTPRRGGGPRPPRRFRTPGNLTPLLRLVALIALAIIVVVVIAVWVEGCSSEKKHDRYANYMADIGSIGQSSAALGDRFATLLTQPGLKQEDLDAKLGGYLQQAESHVQKAEDLRPPGPLHDANDGAVEALEFRVSGLKGLQKAFQDTANADDATTAGQQLAVPAERLLTSDVVWSDRFQAVAQSVMEQENVQGVQVPPSDFIATDDLVTARTLATIWQRIQGAATGGTGGQHGSGIAYVKALPSGTLLSTSTATTIKATVQLAFEVGVEDTGDSQEVRIKVTLTIPKTPNPIVKTGVIPIIDPGETKTVTLKVGNLVPFGETTSVKVDVAPVQGESYTQNNSYEYPVIFSFEP
jgi:hypothetical protein